MKWYFRVFWKKKKRKLVIFSVGMPLFRGPIGCYRRYFKCSAQWKSSERSKRGREPQLRDEGKQLREASKGKRTQPEKVGVREGINKSES